MQVLDGILCHNGEADDVRISPQPCSNWPEFDKKVENSEGGKKIAIPMTLEGCVIKFADTIAYIGRDLQDAHEVGLISDTIPHEFTDVLGTDNRTIINTLIHDLLENSDVTDQGYIAYSHDVERALSDLRSFSRDNIYNNPKMTSEREKIWNMYRTLFFTYLEDLKKERRNSKIFTDYIDATWVSREYIKGTSHAGIVRDFIAGMTDRYFIKRFEDCVIPRRVEGTFH